MYMLKQDSYTVACGKKFLKKIIFKEDLKTHLLIFPLSPFIAQSDVVHIALGLLTK